MVSLVSTSIIIIVCLLFLGLVFYAIFRSQTVHVNPSPPDQKYACPVVPLAELKKCDISDPNSCSKCCIPGPNNTCVEGIKGQYTCVRVDKNHPFKYSSDPTVDCSTNPDKCVNIPDGDWCLPVQITSDKCNPFTSIPVLTKISDRLWKWRCQCRYPHLVTKNNIDADCDQVIACDRQVNPKNNLVCPPQDCNPKCNLDKEVCCGGICTPKSTCDPKCKDGETCCNGFCWAPACKEGEPWDGTYDPTFGVCSCSNPGSRPFKKYDTVTGEYILECVSDFCNTENGGHYDSNNNTCACDAKTGSKGNWKSFVNCPEDVIDESGNGGIDFKGQCQPVGQSCDPGETCDHQCWKDPCNPLGYYDKTLGKCVCDAPLSIEGQSTSSPVGSICLSPCDSEGPNSVCGGISGPLVRGTCYINNAGEPKCNSCRSDNGFVQDPSGLCQQNCTTTGNNCDTTPYGCCPNIKCRNDYCPDGICKICE